MGKPGIPQSHETPVLGGYSKIAHTHPAGYQGGFFRVHKARFSNQKIGKNIWKFCLV
jgi:hypothetical protein